MSCTKKIIIIRFATPFNTKSNLFQFYKHACRQNTCILAVSTFDKQALINTNQMKLQSMPGFTQILQTYINRLYYFGSCIYSLSMGMLMSGLHKPAAEDYINIDARRPPNFRNIYNNTSFLFWQMCYITKMFGNILHLLPIISL